MINGILLLQMLFAYSWSKTLMDWFLFNSGRESVETKILEALIWISLTIDPEGERKPVIRGPGFGGPWSVPIMNCLIFRMCNLSQPIGYVFSGLLTGFPNATPVKVPIVLSGGVRYGADVIGYIMAVANAAKICTQVIVEGIGAAGLIEKEIRNSMEKKAFRNFGEFQSTLKLMEFGIYRM